MSMLAEVSTNFKPIISPSHYYPCLLLTRTMQRLTRYNLGGRVLSYLSLQTWKWPDYEIFNVALSVYKKSKSSFTERRRDFSRLVSQTKNLKTASFLYSSEWYSTIIDYTFLDSIPYKEYKLNLPWVKICHLSAMKSWSPKDYFELNLFQAKVLIFYR